MYITDKAGQKENQNGQNKTSAYICNPHQKQEESRQRMIKEIQKVETKQPNKKQSCISLVSQIRKYKD